jgi:hypothetical protein
VLQLVKRPPKCCHDVLSEFFALSKFYPNFLLSKFCPNYVQSKFCPNFVLSKFCPNFVLSKFCPNFCVSIILSHLGNTGFLRLDFVLIENISILHKMETMRKIDRTKFFVQLAWHSVNIPAISCWVQVVTTLLIIIHVISTCLHSVYENMLKWFAWFYFATLFFSLIFVKLLKWISEFYSRFPSCCCKYLIFCLAPTLIHRNLQKKLESESTP